MMNKFWYLTKFGLSKKIKSKSFVISNIVLLVLIVCIINIDGIISFFGGDFDEKVKIYLVDNTHISASSFTNNFNQVNSSVYTSEEVNNNELVLENNIKEDDIKGTRDIIVELNNDELNLLSARIISDNYIDTITYQIINQSISSTKYELALKNSNIDVEELNKISSPPVIERVILDEEKNSEKENTNIIMSVLFPTLILPFFMLIILLVQSIGTEINEEKSTRSMEIIISNVSAKTHLFAKILSGNIFIIFQTILIFLYGILGFLLRSFTPNVTGGMSDTIKNVLSSLQSSGIMDKLIVIIPITLVLMLLSFLAYSLLAGILASMTVNIEDYQHVQLPIILICLISYYLSFMASMFDGSTFIKALSYFPLISCLLSPALLMIGQVTIIDVFISIGIMILFIYVIMKYGLRIYKIGILNYSTDNIWKKIFKAVKNDYRYV